MSSLANSAIITVNGVAINPLDLSADYNSFGDFFDYRAIDSSSHTGYEKKNKVIIFLTQIHEQIAMIMTASGVGGYSGVLKANVVGTQGGISFIDDPADSGFADVLDGSMITWAFSPNKSDGLIYSGIFGQKWDLNIGLQKLGGGLSGIEVLTFDENKQASIVHTQGISKNHFSMVNIKSIFSPGIIPVSVANTSIIFVLFGLTLTLFRIRMKH